MGDLLVLLCMEMAGAVCAKPFAKIGLVGGSLLQEAFTETLRLLPPALSAVILAIFIDYVLEDWTYVLGSSVKLLAMVAPVERQGGGFTDLIEI